MLFFIIYMSILLYYIQSYYNLKNYINISLNMTEIMAI